MMPIFNGRQVPSDVIAALHAGKIIDAIKNWRAFTGEGLLESKNFIEAIRPQVLGTAVPPRGDRVGESAKGEIPKHELLLKLLKMTASPNDAEALVAMRKANALLASAGWDWDKLLSGKITVVGDPFGNLQRPAAHQPNDYVQPRTPPGRPRPTAPLSAAAQAQAQAAAKLAAQLQNQYQTPPRAKRARTAVNYDDIFSDAQAFGRTS